VRRWLVENRGFLLFLALLGVFRTAVADWNPIPSGSMRPTLLEGDVVLVDRTAYDLRPPFSGHVLARVGEPARGDVVTFRSPRDGRLLIKRIVGLPGDLVELRGDVLVVNGRPMEYRAAVALNVPAEGGATEPAWQAVEDLGTASHAVQFLPERAALRTFAARRVPEGEYFMMGDNRDDSDDSRFIGTVARERIVGRARRVLVSVDLLDRFRPRLERSGRPIL
jgi:signal peptidase I